MNSMHISVRQTTSSVRRQLFQQFVPTQPFGNKIERMCRRVAFSKLFDPLLTLS